MSGGGDEVWSRAEIESPCVKLCVIDPVTQLCLGCKRSLDEIARWSAMPPAERRAIMETLPAREMPRPRQGGRAARLTRKE